MSKKKRVKIKASSSLHDSETAFKLYHACMRREELLARSCELQQQGRMNAAHLASTTQSAVIWKSKSWNES